MRRQVSEFFKCSDRTFIPPGIGGFTHRRSAIMAIRPFGFAAAEGVLSPKHTRSTKEAPHRLGGGVLLCVTHTIRIFSAKCHGGSGPMSGKHIITIITPKRHTRAPVHALFSFPATTQTSTGFIPLKYQHCDRLRPNCDLVAIRSQLISKRPFFELLYNIPLRPIGFPYADNFLVLFQFSHQHLYLVTAKPR